MTRTNSTINIDADDPAALASLINDLQLNMASDGFHPDGRTRSADDHTTLTWVSEDGQHRIGVRFPDPA